MPHTPEEKKKAKTRLRRIRGQAEALERAIDAGMECGEVLQQLAAMRGGMNGLMRDVLEGHMRETLLHPRASAAETKRAEAVIADTSTLMRSYLK